MQQAVERLLAAKQQAEPVAVVGDYDVDGVSGTALLVAVLRACGLETHPILPHRLHDGYGFQPVHAERAQELGCRLVVTVDCGTTSLAACQRAQELGLQVIITDHHLPGPELPPGALLINPQQESCNYPFSDLSGAGLALKLASALASACHLSIDPQRLLRIACLGTVADMVPLRGENRVIAAIGLRELAKTRSPGLQALITAAGLRPPLAAADIGFRLGPRLNAPGRLGSAEPALELLLCRDPQRAQQLAQELEAANRQRQEAERQVTEEAFAGAESEAELPPIIVAWSDSWHRGVVGVAAGRLARQLHRPTILLAVDGGMAVGSGRSIPGIHLYDFLSPWQDRLERFGGHAQAIGMSAEVARLEELRDGWQLAAADWGEQLGEKSYEYELELAVRTVTSRFYQQLRRLEPFGQGNPQPLLRISGPLRLVGSPRIFGRGHLSGEAVAADGGRIRLLGWGWAERQADLDGEFELLGYLEEDRYRGGLVLRLVDSRPASELAA